MSAVKIVRNIAQIGFKAQTMNDPIAKSEFDEYLASREKRSNQRIKNRFPDLVSNFTPSLPSNY